MGCPLLLFVLPLRLLKLGIAAGNRGSNVSRQFHIWIDGKMCCLSRRNEVGHILFLQCGIGCELSCAVSSSFHF